jgi:hypothetical protein
MAWQEAYAVEGTDWNVHDAAHPNGHRGADWKLGAGKVVPAFQKMRVHASNLFSPILGYCLTAQLIGGQYDGWYVGFAHLRGGTRPNNNDILQPGGQIGLVATGTSVRPVPSRTLVTATPDYSGTSWDGPHIHMTLSKTIDGIFIGPTIDPRPIVYAGIGGVSGSSLNVTPVVVTKPLPKPTPTPIPKEWDEMATKEEIRAVVQEVVTATLGNRPATAIISYSSDGDRNGIYFAGAGHWHKFTGEEFTNVYQGTTYRSFRRSSCGDAGQ